MKKSILKLIQDDIKVTQLIHVLQDLNISASSLYLANSSLIFSFMGVAENDENTDAYCKQVERADDLRIYCTPDKVKELATEIYEFLLSLGDQ